MSLIITSPKPFQEIGPEFDLIGSVPKVLLLTSWGAVDMRLFTDYIDINGQTFMGGTIYVRKPSSLLNLFSKRYLIGQIEKFQPMNINFLKESQGRITLKISGDEKVEPIYIPLIIKEFEPEGGVSPEIAKRHADIGMMIKRYEQDLKNYYKELAEINERRKIKDGNKEPQYLVGPSSMEISLGISQILDNSEEGFDEYEYTDEDKQEAELEEKYKDAIAWRGPLLGGIVSRFGPFELRVYSDDHDKHFHVIHKGKGINARFSFPEIQLISYKISRNTISSKQEKKIQQFCLRPEIFSKFEEEFNKRSNIAN